MIRRIQGFRCARLMVALVAVVGLGLSGRGEARERVQWVSAWGFSQQGLTADTETVTPPKFRPAVFIMLAYCSSVKIR